MEQDKRCAMLDADFISKLYESNQMIVRILSIADFNFVCHKQTGIELSRHNHQALQWLNANTDITVYSDRDLIQQMLELFNISAYTYYADMLRRSCDIFSQGFYNQYYGSLDAYLTDSWNNYDLDKFIRLIDSCDTIIGTDNNLGEIKLYTMAQILELCGIEKLFIFCSDDRKARFSLSNQTSVECVGAIASFYLAKRYLCMPKDEAQIYFDSWMDFHSKTNGQTQFRVVSENGRQYERIHGQDILNTIYNDGFDLLKNGFLRKKSSD